MTNSADLPMDLADAFLVSAATEMNEGQSLSKDQEDSETNRWKTSPI
jgi:hypothetical protein